MQLINGRDSGFTRVHFVGRARYRKVEPVRAVQLTEESIVDTPEGEMRAHPGDYLVADELMSHCWPVKKEVFERTYEQIYGPAEV